MSGFDRDVLVATWQDGLFVVSNDGERVHEFAGQPVRGLTGDGQGGALAIVGPHALQQRAGTGEWRTVATADFELACTLAVGDALYVGTDDALMLRVASSGQVAVLPGFNDVAGRDTWFAGSVVINGQVVGPPLGVRSLSATADGKVLLANVHVGGIPRSTDGGASWQPSIEVAADVHEVRAHPVDPQRVVAAAAVGLCISRDAGATWAIETDGLHAAHCSAVAIAGDRVLVSASADPFAEHGAIYTRSLSEAAQLAPVGGGLPRWLDGITDTGCMAVRDSCLAVADRGGNLYVSADAGRSWSQHADGLPAPSSITLV